MLGVSRLASRCPRGSVSEGLLPTAALVVGEVDTGAWASEGAGSRSARVLDRQNPRPLLLEPFCNLRRCFAIMSHIVAAEEREPDLVVAQQSPSLSVTVQKRKRDPPKQPLALTERKRKSDAPKQALPPTKRKRKRDTGMKNLFVTTAGKYGAKITLDGVEIRTRGDCDLPRAVEFLMVLTSIKQKVLCAGAQGSEELLLRGAVVSACDEHGISTLEMSLAFCLWIRVSSFIGSNPLTLGQEHLKVGLAQSTPV